LSREPCAEGRAVHPTQGRKANRAERPDPPRIESGVNRTEVEAPSIAEPWGRLKEQLAEVCARLNRDPATVRIVAVSKQHPASRVGQAIAAGIRDFGENKIQEARAKIDKVAPRPVWHLVGHLQTNKARLAAGLFDWIHSVDSVRVAEALGGGARSADRVLKVLVQVNATAEAQKSGCPPERLGDVVEAVLRQGELELCGLMTIGPESQDEADTRRAFERVARLRDQWREQLGAPAMAHLSMGMSDDWPWALEYGANVIRVGRAIFGPRPGGTA
jgi:pyridoxal phosphate enzyme (YggS family)